MSTLIPVILCGGSGTRLWPLSREHYPKQFVALHAQRSLFQETLQRLKGLSDLGSPIIVSNEEHRFLVAEQLRQIKQQAAVIMLEPEGRNTAPALTLAALWAEEHQPESELMVMPSDHSVPHPEDFRALMPRARELARQGQIVTFGIVPDRPETGYGYIQAEGERLAAFVEKPSAERAAELLADGRYLWNSGMFVVTPAVWLKALAEHLPEMLKACREAYCDSKDDQTFLRPEKSAFLAGPSCSIDYAVMEKTDKGSVLPLDAGWSDVGSWDALMDLSELDANGNAISGDVLVRKASNNYLRSSGRLVAVVGVSDLLVVETPYAILVANQDCAQEIRELAGELRQQQRPEAANHRKVARPWGSYETVDQGERFQVKRITVHPGHALSKQMHHHRAEHWVVVRGTAKVTKGDEVFLLSENQSVYIPLGTVHRLENPGSIDLELIEVQSGPYLGEDDIVRFEDRYQRVK